MLLIQWDASCQRSLASLKFPTARLIFPACWGCVTVKGVKLKALRASQDNSSVKIQLSEVNAWRSSEVSALVCWYKQWSVTQQTRTWGLLLWSFPIKPLKKKKKNDDLPYMLLDLHSTPKISNNFIFENVRSNTALSGMTNTVPETNHQSRNILCELYFYVSSERSPISLEHANDHLSHHSQPHLQIIHR